jgi:hypothetical protein
MPRQANAVDFWRGVALVSIFINHIPGIWYDRLTHRNVSISDSAELFVFLAGWSLGLLVRARPEPMSAGRLVARLGMRALTIYAAQLLISFLALAILAAAAYLLGNPLILELNNAAEFFQHPEQTQIGLVLLMHQLGYFDILPLYVVLMLAAPAIALIDRIARPVLLPASLSLYLAALAVPFTAPTWPVTGQWFFNPFTWQLIFILGFALSRDEGLGAVARRHLRVIRAVSLPVVVFAGVVVYFSLFPDPVQLPEPKLFFLNGKSFLTPVRLLHFLALVAVFSEAFPLFGPRVPRLAEFLSMLGRNSLNVFCVGSLLSLIGQIVRLLYTQSFIVDTIVVAAGIGLLWCTAWVTEWRDRQQAERWRAYALRSAR